MNAFGQTICLSMIVKNEAHVIQRCVNSVRSTIDHWVIVDTGSTDGTQDVIRRAMADIPGLLVERPWVDFASNRNEALSLARTQADYSLIIDADDELIVPPDFVVPELHDIAYRFEIVDDQTRYWRNHLLNNQIDWHYRGVVHEFLECSDRRAVPTSLLKIRRGKDGARHLDRATARRMIAVLEEALTTETDPFMIARYTFYLANAYHEASEFRKSMEFHLKRADQGYWDEEIYVALLLAADAMERLDEPEGAILTLYDRMIPIRPERAEARLGASRYCRRKGHYAAGYRYAATGVDLVLPSDGISLNPWVYSFGVREELAVNAFHLGQCGVCLYNCNEILGQSNIPDAVRKRVHGLARRALTQMVDPLWGCRQSRYSLGYAPSW